jgi:DUF4097 and DUF4098 domain-containing protein YvlB
MKKVAIGALIALIIGMIGLFTVSDHVFSYGNNVEINERETISAKDIKEVKIDVEVGEVQLKESQDDNIEIHFHGNVPKKVKEQITFKVEEDGSSVEVVVNQAAKSFIQIPFINSDLKSERILDVSIPKGLLDKLEVQANVGDIQIDRIDTSVLTAHSDVGDIQVNQFKGEGNFVSNVGDVELENINGKIHAQSDTGEIDISLEEMSDDIELTSDVGDINVQFKNEPENVRLDLRSDVGDVTINGFESIKDASTGSIITQIGSGGPALVAKTDIGDIEIEN